MLMEKSEETSAFRNQNLDVIVENSSCFQPDPSHIIRSRGTASSIAHTFLNHRGGIRINPTKFPRRGLPTKTLIYRLEKNLRQCASPILHDLSSGQRPRRAIAAFNQPRGEFGSGC